MIRAVEDGLKFACGIDPGAWNKISEAIWDNGEEVN